MKKLILPTLLAATAMSASAGITATSDNFSTNANVSSWLNVGTVKANISHLAKSLHDGGTAKGDKLDQDGGLCIGITNKVPEDEAVGLTIKGTMEKGKTITFTYGLYNANNSYNKVKAQLYNLTDKKVLAESDYALIKGPTAPVKGEAVDGILTYKVTESDDGDQLQIRFVEFHKSTSRIMHIDNFSVSSK